ncbi:MAG: hypothetical protein KJ066_13750 [Acidobacteria bacterium]|nr:hypothetical protein [Acidobacteriota bacterium]
MPVPRITREELATLIQGDDIAARPVVVDARLKYPFEHSTLRLPGAVRVSPIALDFEGLPGDRLLVVYDSDPGELVAAEVVAALIAKGFRAAALAGGLPDWIAANLPTEPKDTPRGAAPAAGAPQG